MKRATDEPSGRYVTPACCADVQRYYTVFLRYPIDTLSDAAPDYSVPPPWVARCLNAEMDLDDFVPVSHCPHCGTRLAPPRPRVPLKVGRKVIKVRTVTDDSDDCASCGKSLGRFGYCTCHAQEFRWTP